MARPQSVMDMMHVPTPHAVTEALRALLDIPPGVHALDPCCGTGEALAALVDTGHTYGIELDLQRALAARGRLGRAIAGSLQEARVAHGAFGLILLNPPYDDSTEGRLEQVFLSSCTPYLCQDGVLVLIIKHDRFDTVAKLLCRHYDVLAHWRFPDGYYDGPHLAFRQTCLVCRRRRTPNHTKSVAVYMQEDLGLGAELPPPPAQLPQRCPVPSGHEPIVFHCGRLSMQEMAAALGESTVPRTQKLPPVLGCGRPPLPLEKGSRALVLASGVINGVYGRGEELHVAKGSVVRQIARTVAYDTTDEGRAVVTKTATRSFAIQIRALRPDGSIVNVVGAEGEVEEHV